jgi:hypothetical protein
MIRLRKKENLPSTELKKRGRDDEDEDKGDGYVCATDVNVHAEEGSTQRADGATWFTDGAPDEDIVIEVDHEKLGKTDRKMTRLHDDTSIYKTKGQKTKQVNKQHPGKRPTVSFATLPTGVHQTLPSIRFDEWGELVTEGIISITTQTTQQDVEELGDSPSCKAGLHCAEKHLSSKLHSKPDNTVAYTLVTDKQNEIKQVILPHCQMRPKHPKHYVVPMLEPTIDDDYKLNL